MARKNGSRGSDLPAATYTFSFQAQYPNKPGMLAQIAAAVGECGGNIGDIDVIRSSGTTIVREISVSARDSDHAREIVEHVKATKGVTIKSVADRVFLSHRGGKIEIRNKVPVTSRRDLSVVYTPGVARVCLAIDKDPDLAYSMTIKGNTVAVVSDGTAILGLGDLGPKAAMPVMEGKAMLFKAFGGVDAWPICLDTKDPDEIVAIVKAIAPGLRRHQPGGHLRAPLLLHRRAAEEGAGHPRLPRRPARHGRRRARRAAQRAAHREEGAART